MAIKPRPNSKRRGPSPPGMLVGMLGLGALIVAGGAFVLLTGKGNSLSSLDASSTPSAIPAPTREEKPPDAYESARRRAEREGSLGALNEFAELAWSRAEEASSRNDDATAKRFRTEAKNTYRKILSRDSENENARDRLGDVLYYRDEVDRILSSSSIPPSLKTDIEVAADDIETNVLKGKGRRVWLSTQDTTNKEWADLMQRVAAIHRNEQAKLNDPFYARAEEQGKALSSKLSAPSTSASLRRGSVEGEVFSMAVANPFVILMQREPDGSEAKSTWHLVQALQDFYDSYRALLGEKLASALADPLIVIVLQDPTEYAKYRTFFPTERRELSPAGGGHVEPDSRRIVTFRQEGNAEIPFLFHESVRLLLALRIGDEDKVSVAMRSFWASRGLPAFFEGFSKGYDENRYRQRFLPGMLISENIEILESARTAKKLLPLKTLIASNLASIRKLEKEASEVAHAQAWAFVYFLARWQGGKRSDDLVRAIEKVFAGIAPDAAMDASIAAHKIEDLENELEGMIQELAAALTANRIVNGALLR